MEAGAGLNWDRFLPRSALNPPSLWKFKRDRWDMFSHILPPYSFKQKPSLGKICPKCPRGKSVEWDLEGTIGLEICPNGTGGPVEAGVPVVSRLVEPWAGVFHAGGNGCLKTLGQVLETLPLVFHAAVNGCLNAFTRLETAAVEAAAGGAGLNRGGSHGGGCKIRRASSRSGGRCLFYGRVLCGEGYSSCS